MGKFANDLSEDLQGRVRKISQKLGINNTIDVRPIRMKKTKKEIGTIIKGNDLTEIFTGNDSIVAIALYEEAFDVVDDETKDFWIENLLSQVSYDMDKDKIVITKPDMPMMSGMYNKYGDKATQKLLLANLTVAQILEQEKELKGK